MLREAIARAQGGMFSHRHCQRRAYNRGPVHIHLILPELTKLSLYALNCSVVGGALFHEPAVDAACGGLVIVRDIDFASTSEATLLPFYGRCHLGYLPSQGVVLGLSKVARLVSMLAKRLQTQERFTQELLAAFDSEVLSQVLNAARPVNQKRCMHSHPTKSEELKHATPCMQGCAVFVEAHQLEYGQKAPALMTSARRGCFLQEHVMQVEACA